MRALLLTLLVCFVYSSFAQQLGFNTPTPVTCPSNNQQKTYQKFTLTTTSIPSTTPAQHFVLQLLGAQDTVNVFASLSADVSETNYNWTSIQGNFLRFEAEVWIQAQTPNTVVYVLVVCQPLSKAGTFTVRPVIPGAIAKQSNSPFWVTSGSTTDPAVGYWYAFVAPYSDETGPSSVSFQTEVCTPFQDTGYLWSRFVFPERATTTNKCFGGEWLDGTANCELVTSWSAVMNVGYMGVFYVFVSAANYTSLISENWSMHVVDNFGGQDLWVYTAAPPTGTALKLNKDLLLYAAHNSKYPSDVSNIQLYYTNGANQNTTWFSSSCYLKTIGQKYVYNGQLVNATTDKQLAASNLIGFKVPNFFSQNDYNRNSQYTILVNGYVTLSVTLPNELSANITYTAEDTAALASSAKAYKTSTIALGVTSGVAVAALFLGFLAYRSKMQTVYAPISS